VKHYYNEFDRYPAQWLRNLMDAGQITGGVVDERSIVDVLPDELKGFTQCHFFAGIAGWPLALKMAGWPQDRQIWSASLPCQPFSNAGLRKGQKDERHLWPIFFNLVRECRPEFVIGEQVEAAIRMGWLDGIFTDLEAEGYTCGAVVLGAHSVGAPHIRQRLFWVAHTSSERHKNVMERSTESSGQNKQRETAISGRSGTDCGVGNAESDNKRRSWEPCEGDRRKSEAGRSSAWSDYILAPCADGKARRVGFRLTEVVDGISRNLERPRPIDILTVKEEARVGKIKAYGNAICSQTAAEFIKAFMECETK
jgi:DNA (cytosine-5)-methyltransferase 1